LAVILPSAGPQPAVVSVRASAPMPSVTAVPCTFDVLPSTPVSRRSNLFRRCERAARAVTQVSEAQGGAGDGTRLVQAPLPQSVQVCRNVLGGRGMHRHAPDVVRRDGHLPHHVTYRCRTVPVQGDAHARAFIGVDLDPESDEITRQQLVHVQDSADSGVSTEGSTTCMTTCRPAPGFRRDHAPTARTVSVKEYCAGKSRPGPAANS
jgi:hypothetical protein